MKFSSWGSIGWVSEVERLMGAFKGDLRDYTLAESEIPVKIDTY
jgi:hypothetical protein